MRINTKKQRIILAIIVLILLAGSGFLMYRHTSDSGPKDEWIDGVNYRPPTDEEQMSGDDKKEKIVATGEQDSDTSQSNENQSQNTADEKKNATVIITDAGQYGDIIEVRSFIPDHYQDGTCTITFTKDSLILSKETPAYKDVSTTICTNSEFKSSEFKTKGTWKVTVSYESTNATGTSDAQEVVIN